MCGSQQFVVSEGFPNGCVLLCKMHIGTIRFCTSLCILFGVQGSGSQVSAAGGPLHTDDTALYEGEAYCTESAGTRIFVGEITSYP